MKLAISALIILMSVGAASAQRADFLGKLVAAERAFAGAVHEKGIRSGFLEYLAEDGVLFEPGPVNGKKHWQERSEAAGLLAWNPVWVDVSQDGSIGFTTGDWQYYPDRAGQNAVAHGQYVTVWKAGEDGTYRVALDVGISHPKPNETESDWKSPPDAEPAGRRKIPDFAPRYSFTGSPDYRKAADEIRVYREGKLPIIGKKQAVAHALSERSARKDWNPSPGVCHTQSDFTYCYARVEITKTDGGITQGNLVRFWKAKNGKWRLILDLFAPIPEGSK